MNKEIQILCSSSSLNREKTIMASSNLSIFACRFADLWFTVGSMIAVIISNGHVQPIVSVCCGFLTVYQP